MNKKEPILVIQMQRMGDLIISFPLLGWLSLLYPDHPIWVIGEEKFFHPLMPLSPEVVYFSYGNIDALKGIKFKLVINLSHRKEAAEIAGRVDAHKSFGLALSDKEQIINGGWQLYRSSIVHNNRLNLFHWGDLNGLGIVDKDIIKKTYWPRLKSFNNERAMQVGLFLGASEDAKRPGVEFWTALTKFLLQEGFKPVLLGGEKEKDLGYMVSKGLGSGALNLCGRFNVKELASFISGLDLLVSPDTGPMHLAVWSSVPVLNLSMGPVNPWETGPMAPGHYVLRADLPCLGCWECEHEEILCKELFIPRRVGQVIKALAADFGNPDISACSQDLILYRTARDAYGLYQLEELVNPKIDPQNKKYPRPYLASFWKAWFGESLGVFEDGEALKKWSLLKDRNPDLASSFQSSLKSYMISLAGTTASAPSTFLTDKNLWHKAPRLLRPFSGYSQMYIQNYKASHESLLRVIFMAESLLDITRT